MKQMHDSLFDDLAGIARYEVSEDGVAWRPYNPQEDGTKTLHKRIHFAVLAEESASPLSAQSAY